MRIILQARTSSQRLPAKVLLPVGGRPLAILCAQRLSNRDCEVLLATSTDTSDDELVDQAGAYGINVFRGSLDNVAERISSCVADLADEAIVVRATADNPIPDGEIVEMMADDLAAAGATYMGPACYSDIPCGLGVEVFSAGALRRSLAESFGDEIAEHVTPALVRTASCQHGRSERFALGSNVRLTVDNLVDYLVAARAFRSVENPLTSDWRDMAEAFARARAGVR